MKLTRLNLAKFAMFSDVELGLLADGVNVIVGANEAGKTTTMAAIQQLFYGIPVRSEHSYVHANADLRIGGVLRSNDGSELELHRIKRNTATLRSAADATIAEDVMTELLGGVEADVYATLFSIGHEEIASGGKALLESEGELGRALFGAGTGLTQLNAVMNKLDAKTGQLFKSGASKPLINGGIVRHKQLLAEIKEHTQSASAVEQMDKALAKAESRLAQIDQEHQELSVTLSRATRVRSTRPQIQRRRQGKLELAALDASGPRVGTEIPDLLTAAQDDRRTGRSSLAALEPDLASLDAKLTELVVDELLVAQAPVVERLVEELGGIRQNLKDLPGLNKQVGDLERDLAGHLRRVPDGCRKDDNGMPTLSDVERSRIERLGQEQLTIDSRLVTSRLSRAAAEGAHGRHSTALEDLPPARDVSRLRPAMARIRAEGQLEATADKLEHEAAGVLSGIEAAISVLGVTVGARDADGLALPVAARVSEVDRLVSDALSAVEVACSDDGRLKAELGELESQLTGLLERTDPPSVDELDRARTHRDEGWQLVRAAWLGEAPPEAQVELWTEGQPLDVTFESDVKRTDEIADRLRHDAESVERRALLEQQIVDKHASIALQVETIAAGEVDHMAAMEYWSELWAPLGVEARSRLEMDEFLATARDTATAARTLRTMEGSLAEQRSRIQRCIIDLRGLLDEVGDTPPDSSSLVGLLDRAESICATSDEAYQKRLVGTEALDLSRVALDGQDQDLAAAEKALTSWEQEWGAAIQPLGVAASTSPVDVATALSTLKAIDEGVADLDEKRRRVAGMERRNAEVGGQVGGVLAALAHLTVDTTASEVAINSLQRLLKEAQKDMATRTSLQGQRDAKEFDVQQARASVASSDANIDALITQTDVEDETALVQAVDRTQQAALLAAEIDTLESNLIDATGIALAQLEAEVDDSAETDLDTTISDLSARVETCDGERTAAAEELGGIRTERRSIGDSDAAAMAAERAQLTLAEVANHTDEYVRVTLARYLLDQQIAEYRMHNQGPILVRAGEIFGRLTLDKYSGIDTDADAKGNPFLLAKRDSGGSSDVSALSADARDQLYLSLRLAALEHYAVGSRSLPLLLDDVFVHFDDDRTRAGLSVLEDLSSRMQVLLFTHHERVADQAAEAISSDKLRVQVLTSTP